MVRMNIKYRIDPGADHRCLLDWSYIFGLAGIILFSGRQSIPSDLMKTFPKESTQYIYDFPVQPGLEWWYQGKILEDDHEESYISRDIVTGIDPLGESAFLFLLKETQAISEIKLSTNKRIVAVVYTTRTWQTKETGVVKFEYHSEAFRSLAPLGTNKVQNAQEELLGVLANTQLE